jgi:hypothetical protein
MWMIKFYGSSVALLAILIGPMIWAIRRANRVCKSRTWPQTLALICWILCIVVTLGPYAIYGAQWAMVWIMLTFPFSMLFERWAGAIGTVGYMAMCSIITATFWTTIVYGLCALVLSFRRTSLSPR